jgi:UDP-glucose 4-epimerase
MNFNNKKILIIGGARFIGSHVVSALLKTEVDSVVIYDNLTIGKKAIFQIGSMIADVNFLINKMDIYTISDNGHSNNVTYINYEDYTGALGL